VNRIALWQILKGVFPLADEEDVYQPELNDQCISQMFNKKTLVTASDNSYGLSIEEDRVGLKLF
jgi:hypothetical protein